MRLCALYCVAAAALAQIPASYTFTVYDVPGAIATRIDSVNDRGDIAGTYVTADNITHAFVRPANGTAIATFTAPDGSPASTPAINASGQIAYAGVAGGATALYLRSADGVQSAPLGTVAGTGFVTGINGQGQVIGWAFTKGPDVPFLRNADGSTPAIHLNRFRNFGINNSGQVLWVDNSQTPPYNATVYLDNADGTASGKYLSVAFNVGNAAMSENGLVAGTFENTNPGHGFVGDLATNRYVPLDVPGYAAQTQVNGVNDFGVVVGTAGAAHGFIATPSATPPVLAQGGITNAASYANTAIAPGEVVTLFGTGLGPPALTMSGASTRVLFNGTPAPLIYARGDQVSAVVPYEVSGPTAKVEVEFQGAASGPVTVPVTPSAPGIFTVDGSGNGPGIVLNQDGSINTAVNPAKRGEIIVLYATGLGQTAPAGATGQITPIHVPVVLQQPLPITVMVGGRQAEILYDGPAPGIIAGVSQVNVVVPLDAPAGATVPVTIQAGDATSRAVTVALK